MYINRFITFCCKHRRRRFGGSHLVKKTLILAKNVWFLNLCKLLYFFFGYNLVY